MAAKLGAERAATRATEAEHHSEGSNVSGLEANGKGVASPARTTDNPLRLSMLKELIIQCQLPQK